MRKGDLRKQEILQTAEELFCKKGYEDTSVQDILDILHLSKGSFYHHYESKESLLEAICVRRASDISERSIRDASSIQDSMEKLAFLYAGLIPLRDERLSFLLMLLPVFSTPQGRSIRSCYCDALSAAFREPIQKQLQICNEKELVLCPDIPFFTEITVKVINDMWCNLCDLMIRSVQEGNDLPDLSAPVHHYRMSVERLLSAPYGSVSLLSIPDLFQLFRGIDHTVRLHG